MRVHWVAAAIALAACGDDERTPPAPADSAVADAPVPLADADPDRPDADPTAPDARPMRADADPDAPDAGRRDGVRCGDRECDPGQVCCLREVGPTVMPTCQAPADPCAPGLLYACDGPEDCAGAECCETAAGSSCADPGSSCATALCNSADDCDVAGGEMCCPPGGASTPWTYDRCLATPICPL
jgi:hypothetical protein